MDSCCLEVDVWILWDPWWCILNLSSKPLGFQLILLSAMNANSDQFFLSKIILFTNLKFIIQSSTHMKICSYLENFHLRSREEPRDDIWAGFKNINQVTCQMWKQRLQVSNWIIIEKDTSVQQWDKYMQTNSGQVKTHVPSCEFYKRSIHMTIHKN